MADACSPKLTRRRSLLSLKRSCSGSLNLDNLIFKSPSLGMTPKKKRKRLRNDDECVSLQSVDIDFDEPKKRRRSSLARMSSLSNLLSPIKPVKKVGQALQKSLSLKSLVSPSQNKYLINAYKKPQPTPPKRRQSIFWYETVNSNTSQMCSSKERERQEAIFELYRSEEDLIGDLIMVKQTYHDSMSKLKLMSEDDLKQIFGPITQLVSIHEELVCSLSKRKQQDGTTDSIGQVILDWVPRLKEYVPYCSNQVYARALLDAKKQEAAVDDFLQRCQDSPFSRRLDLWSFLDVPRSSLVKYPLLLKSIEKYTPADHPDRVLLQEACEAIRVIIEQVDKKTGEAKCQLTQSKLEFIDDKQKTSLINESKVILCDGIMKNNRGTKLYVFLFEKVLVLTRLATRGQKLRYQVYRHPIPADQLMLNEYQDGHGKSGSFRSTFSQSTSSKTSFRVSLKDGGKGQSHTLFCNDEHDKRQWLQSIKSIIPKENIAEAAPSSSDEEAKENHSV